MRNNQRIAMFGGTDYDGKQPSRELAMWWEAASYTEQENYFNRTPYLDSGLALVALSEWDPVKGLTQKLPPELIFQYTPVPVFNAPPLGSTYLDTLAAAIADSWSCYITDPDLVRKPADDETLRIQVACGIPLIKGEKPPSAFNLIEFKPDHKLGHSFLLSITYDGTGKPFLELTVKTVDGYVGSKREELSFEGVCTFSLYIEANRKVSVACNDLGLIELDIAGLDITYDQGTMNFMRYTGKNYKDLGVMLFESLYVRRGQG